MTGLSRTSPPPTSTRSLGSLTVEPQLHEQRVLAVRIVAAAHSGFPKTEGSIQRDRRLVVATHFEQRASGTRRARLVQGSDDQAAADRTPPPIRMNRDVLDLEHVFGQPPAQIPDERRTPVRQHDLRKR